MGVLSLKELGLVPTVPLWLFNVYFDLGHNNAKVALRCGPRGHNHEVTLTWSTQDVKKMLNTSYKNTFDSDYKTKKSS